MADEDWQWLKANANPSNDSSTAGGAKTTTALTGGATGEVLTQLRFATCWCSDAMVSCAAEGLPRRIQSCM